MRWFPLLCVLLTAAQVLGQTGALSVCSDSGECDDGDDDGQCPPGDCSCSCCLHVATGLVSPISVAITAPVARPSRHVAFDETVPLSTDPAAIFHVPKTA